MLTPTDLTDEEADLLHKFAELRGETTGNKSMLDKIKEAFR